MSRLILVSLFISLCLSAAAPAGDLYTVGIGSQDEAELLSGSAAEAIMVIQGGYLVLADSPEAEALRTRGLDIQKVATDVSRDELAVDQRFDEANAELFPVMYEEKGVRLFRLSHDWAKTARPASLMALPEAPPTIIYKAPAMADAQAPADVPGLEALMALIERDSLQSYTERLQAFNGRKAGSDSSRAARDWLVSKFVEFGFDSIMTDTFTGTIGGDPTELHNVIATRPGQTQPDRHIIIGAHYDAVTNSPGADDNGSGTAAVLEMARIFQGIDTDATFIFVLFDGEEYGLYGSWYYSGEANARGDDILFMFNLDMIGFIENSDRASLYNGYNVAYSLLWEHLADSLMGIGTELAGTSTRSDHYPFTYYGYDASFVIEYIFSDVYHTPEDSTTRMSFDYVADLTKISAATVYAVDYAQTPRPALTFTFPDGAVKAFTAETSHDIDVLVEAVNGGVAVPGSAELHYAVDGGDYVIQAMTDLGGGLYRGTFPPMACGSRISYYVTAVEGAGGAYSDVSSATPHTGLTLHDDGVAFADDFESDLGWTVSGDATTGQWERGVPVGGGDRGDPATDFDGSGQCFLTGNTDGDSDVDNGFTYLMSPVIPLSSDIALVRYLRWYDNGDGGMDTMRVYVSNNGGLNWFPIDTIGPVYDADGGWVEHSFWLNDIFASSDSLQLLFAVSDVGRAETVEAAVDAVRVTLHSADPLTFVATTLPDWTAAQPYVAEVTMSGGIGPYAWLDMNGDLDGTGLTLDFQTGVVSGVAMIDGPIEFTAWVGDAMGNYVMQSYAFTMNGGVTLTAASPPDGEVNVAYSHQLMAMGGTGELAFSDVGGDLEGTGLTLSPGGLITGIVTTPMTVNFTARAEDFTGSFDDESYAFEVVMTALIGDANGDGDVDVGDAVYIINYVFKDGPAPDPEIAGDANCDGEVNVGDAVYLINYVFKGGPEPVCP